MFKFTRLFVASSLVLAPALLASTAIAESGLLGNFVSRMAEHAAVREAAQRVETKVKSPALVPGRDGPLAPSGNQGFAACPHLFPGNTPVNVDSIAPEWRAVGLCSNHFVVLSSGLTKTPLVVVEKLNKAMLADAKGEERTNQFYPDPRLAKGSRAELEDYKAFGPMKEQYDRGHLANAADQPDQQSMIQSFALSNMIPQDPFNNRKTWTKIESDVRKFAGRASGDVFVFSGPLFRRDPTIKIGPNQVWVPSHLFKLVYDETSGRSWAYILANTAEARAEQPMSYDEFVAKTGWQLLGPGRPAK
jgi:endonuclease G